MSWLLVTVSLWWIFMCSDYTEPQAVRTEKCISKAERGKSHTGKEKIHRGKREMKRGKMKIIKGSCKKHLFVDRDEQEVPIQRSIKLNLKEFLQSEAHILQTVFSCSCSTMNLYNRLNVVRKHRGSYSLYYGVCSPPQDTLNCAQGQLLVCFYFLIWRKQLVMKWMCHFNTGFQFYMVFSDES